MLISLFVLSYLKVLRRVKSFISHIKLNSNSITCLFIFEISYFLTSISFSFLYIFVTTKHNDTAIISHSHQIRLFHFLIHIYWCVKFKVVRIWTNKICQAIKQCVIVLINTQEKRFIFRRYINSFTLFFISNLCKT